MKTISKKRICAAAIAAALCAVSFSGCGVAKIKKDPAAYLISLENNIKDSVLEFSDSDKASKDSVSVDFMLSEQFVEDKNFTGRDDIDAQDIRGSVIIDSACSDGLSQNIIKLKLNNEDIVTVDTYNDSSKKNMYLSIPSENSTCYKFSYYAINEYADEIGISSTQDVVDTLSGIYTSFVDSYTNQIKNSNVTFEPKYELEVNGVTQTCMEFTVELDDDATLDIVDDLISGFRKSNKALYHTIYSEIAKELDDEKYELKPEFTIKTYVDSSDNIIGRNIEADIIINFPEYKETFDISFEISDLSARKGKELAFIKSAELSFDGDGMICDANVSVNGKGSVGKGKLLSGNMILSSDFSANDKYTEDELGFINQLDNMMLSFENVDINASKNGFITGKFTFDLEQLRRYSEWKKNKLIDYYGLPEENIHSKFEDLFGYKAVLTCDNKDKDKLVDFRITDGISDYFSLSVLVRNEELKDTLTLPSDYVGIDDPYDITDEVDIYSILEKVNRILGSDIG